MTTTYVYSIPEQRAYLTFTHQHAKGLFVLSTKEGNIERFRDNATRFLVVEPDPETGELRPR